MNIKKIYIINLKRRKDKLKKMIKRINHLDKDQNIDIEIFYGVDGTLLNEDYLKKNNIILSTRWRDPFKDTVVNKGEVGCAMSHYKIWQNIIKENYNYALIIEDDAVFCEDFLEKFNKLNIPNNMDLMYMGRKKFKDKEKKYTKNIVIPGYSWWTIGYFISYSGANKLVNSNYTKSIIPVDEFLPIMFGEDHPNAKEKYMKDYNITNKLIAYSAEPLLINPEENAFLDSETENSISFNKCNKYKDFTYKIIINSNNKESDTYKRLVDSLDHFNIIYVTTDKEIGKYLIDCKSNGNNELIISIPNETTILTSTINELIDKFLMIGKRVVFGCYKMDTDESLIYNYQEHYKFININQYIGYRDDIISLCKVDKKHKLEFIKQNNQFAVDNNCNIFYQIDNSLGEFNIDVIKSRLVNMVKKTIPCIISTKNDTTIFNNITNYIPFNFRGSYGYNKKNDLKENIKNKQIIICIFNNTVGKSIENLKLLDYPKNKIKLLIYCEKNSQQKDLKNIQENNEYKGIIIKTVSNKKEAFKNCMEHIKIDKAEYLLLIDKNINITVPNMLTNLIKRNKNIVAPFCIDEKIPKPNFSMKLYSYGNDVLPDFNQILSMQFKGCWKVPSIESIILFKTTILEELNMEEYPDNLTKITKYFLHVDNHELYGKVE